MKKNPTTNTILVVDDNQDNLHLLSDLLSENGYTINTAMTGQEAIASAIAKRPDIILLDVRLPDIIGYEVCATIKANEKTNTIPVIFISAFIDIEDKLRGFTAGGVDYITKPFIIKEVLIRVKTHLEISRLHLQMEAQTAELKLINERLQVEVNERKIAAEKLNQSFLKLENSKTAALNLLEDLKIEIEQRKLTEKKIRETQILLQASIESPKDMIVLAIDKNYQYLNFNSFHKKVMNIAYGKDVEIGMNLLDCITNDDDRRKSIINYDRALNGESHITIEEYGDLQRSYYETRYNPILNEKNEVIGATAFSANITERIKAAEALRVSEVKFHSLYTNMIEGSALHELIYNEQGIPEDYIIVDANPAFELQLGISRDYILGKKSREAYGVADPPFLDVYANVALTGEPKIFETYFPPLAKHFSISVYCPRKGSFATIFEDITERKRAEEAQKRLLHILESSLNEIYIFDAESLLFEYVNQGALQNLGYTLDIMKGMTPVDLKPEFTEASFRKVIKPLLDNKQKQIIFYTVHRRADGSLYPVEVHLQLVEHEGHRVFLAVILDITERKKAEEALRKSEEQLKFALSGTNDGIWDVRMDTGAVYISPRGCEILGYRPEEHHKIVDQWNQLVHPEDLPATNEALAAYLEGKTPLFTIEQRLKTATGEWIWILTRGKSVSYDSNGKSLRMVGTHTDITKRKEAEEAIKTLNAELEQRVEERTAQLQAANKELEAFSYSVSHDLRAPLRGINGFTQILMEDYAPKLDDEGKRVCSTIKESSQKMGQLIDDLLAFARLGRSEMQHSVIDMKTMVNSIYHEITDANLRERIQLNIGEIPDVHADPTLMRQVWANLLSNAIKYSSKKKKAIISVTSIVEKEKYIYCVKDNGVGFDMNYVNKLFGVFQRLHSTKDFEGTGVGLAIVQRIVSRHGGEVWAEGKVDKGASFYFSLPERH